MRSLESVCSTLKAAQDHAFQETGLAINTYGLTAADLSDQLKRKNGICIAAFDQDTAAGSLCVFDDHSDRWFAKSGREIKYVSVLPSCQGKGIASKLLDLAKETVSDEVLTVSTDERNKGAVNLYQKNGFALIDISRGRRASSNAVRFAYWKTGCPLDRKTIASHLRARKLKCLIKSLIPFL
ncbi:MAG: GNAT family N-acetyltransferase [Solobacterium sp.]|nr:GNAT family N-acetyltransferase [Solobacterium sp.]